MRRLFIDHNSSDAPMENFQVYKFTSLFQLVSGLQHR